MGMIVLGLSFLLFEALVVLFEFGHVLEWILARDVILSEVLVFALNPNLPHLHVGKGLIGESEIKFVHFWGHGPWFCPVRVSADAHHHRIQHYIEVFEFWQVAFLHQTLVGYVYCSGH